ncbi:MAG: hypothetical protein AAB553_02890 [Patescibacteria group bacterium]
MSYYTNNDKDLVKKLAKAHQVTFASLTDKVFLVYSSDMDTYGCGSAGPHEWWTADSSVRMSFGVLLLWIGGTVVYLLITSLYSQLMIILHMLF